MILAPPMHIYSYLYVIILYFIVYIVFIIFIIFIQSCGF